MVYGTTLEPPDPPNQVCGIYFEPGFKNLDVLQLKTSGRLFIIHNKRFLKRVLIEVLHISLMVLKLKCKAINGLLKPITFDLRSVVSILFCD